MSKIIDITNKLNFEEKPKILVKDTEIEVNNDAISFIKAIALFDSENGVSTSDLLSALELLFDEDDASGGTAGDEPETEETGNEPETEETGNEPVTEETGDTANETEPTEE